MLPSSHHLRPEENSPLRLKSFQLGPTAHVLEQAPLVGAIWHPLAPSGDCLVTITHDACVRLWELDSENRSSFDEPALAVDLKKLANATSTQTDFSASKYGTNKGFSPDDIEMQVAAACFGGQGRDDEHGWASMTLWVAMTEGDVYALCPFLPSRWSAPATLLPSLSTSVMEKSRALGRDSEASQSERRIVDQQCKWLAEVDAQEPILYPGLGDFDTVEGYSRPEPLSSVPKLQGPFYISPEPDFGEITDIHVIAPKIDDEALYDDENEDEDPAEGLSVGVVCLATSTNEVHVCLDVDGVEAEWLPSKRSRAYTFDDVDEPKELLLFETIDLARTEAEDDGWPTFTVSPLDRYELFATHPMGVTGLSFKPWIGPLEDELSTPADSGAGFRLNVVLDSAKTLIDHPVEMPTEPDRGINTAIAIHDRSIGYIVLTAALNMPFATILDVPSHAHPYEPDLPDAAGALPAPEPRAPYRPAPQFEQPSALPRLIKTAKERKLLANDLNSQVRFSPATLQLLTEAHRIMSTETHRLGMAAADLFRRCERMRSELQEQVRKVAEIASRVENVVGNEEEIAAAEGDSFDRAMGVDGGHEEGKLFGKAKIEHRIEMAQQKTEKLNERYEALRRKVSKLGWKELSAKEKAFADEVERLEASIQSPANDPSADSTPPASSSLTGRYEAVESLQQKLIQQATDPAFTAPNVQDEGKEQLKNSSGVGSEFRNQKLAQVMQLLERETALVEAVMERLQRLQRA